MAFKHLPEDWQFLQKGELKGTTDVTPAKAGVQKTLKRLDFRLLGNDITKSKEQKRILKNVLLSALCSWL